MKFHQSLIIDAPAEVVWSVLTDLEAWPEWTPSMTSVRPLDASFGVGSRVEITQPRLAKAVWTITRLDQGQRFDWTTASAGVTTTARHVVDTTSEGTRTTLHLEQSRLLAPAVGLAFGRLTRRYVDLELAGLKDRAESIQ